MNQINQTRNNKDINSDTLEVLRQIKKQADEISTTEGSIRFLRSLSNPTNLTNPQIIGTQKTSFVTSQTPRYIKKETRRVKKRNFFKVKSNININRDELFNSQKLENLRNISIKRNIIKDINFEKDCVTTKGKVILEPIWEKLNQKMVTKEKNRCIKKVRVNIRKDAFAREFIDNSKMISLYKYQIDAKKEQYNKIIELKDTQILFNNKTERQIYTLQNNIINNYNTKYVHYIKFLGKTLDKENKVVYDLENNIVQIKDDIDKLNETIAKLFETKLHILKWIELFIKVKEKIIEVPNYYIDILEQFDNYKIFNSQDEFNKIIFNKDFTYFTSCNGKFGMENFMIDDNIKEKILNYRYNLIFQEPEDFMIQYSKLEKNWLTNLEQHDNMIKDIDKLKKVLNEYDESSFLEDEKILKEKLIINKNIYSTLKRQYDLLKNQNTRKIKKITIDKIEPSNSAFSMTNIYNTFNNKIVDNLNFYNLKSKSITKKRTSSIFNSNIIYSNIYKLIINLFEIVSENNFVKFDESIFIENKNNTNPIFDIMNYIELVINLLIEEKNRYLNNPKLKEKYKKTKDGLSLELKRIRILKLKKMKELTTNIKLKKIKDKGISHQYYPTRKIDFSLYKKLKKMNLKHENKTEIKKEDKKFEPNLEDFLYDNK